MHRRSVLGLASSLIVVAAVGCTKGVAKGRATVVAQHIKSNFFSDGPEAEVSAYFHNARGAHHYPSIADGSSAGVALVAPTGDWFAVFGTNFGNEQLYGSNDAQEYKFSRYSMTDGTIVKTDLVGIHQSTDWSSPVHISANAQYVASKSEFPGDQSLRILDVVRQKMISLKLNSVDRPWLLSISDEGRILVLDDTDLRLHDGHSGQLISSVSLNSRKVNGIHGRILKDDRTAVLITNTWAFMINLESMTVEREQRIEGGSESDVPLPVSEVGFDSRQYAWLRQKSGKLILMVQDLESGEIEVLWTADKPDSFVSLTVPTPTFARYIRSEKVKKAAMGKL